MAERKQLYATTRTRIAAAAAAVVTAVAGIGVATTEASAVIDARAAQPGIHSESAVRLLLGDSTCTGTLISPEWVLTAKHCVSDSGPLNEVRIGATRVSEAFQARQAILHPNADLAVIQLDRPSSAPTANLSGAQLHGGAQGTAIGWGGVQQHQFFNVQQASGEIQRRVTNVPSPDPSAVLLESRMTGGRLQGGDSGGPLFANGEVAGVLSMSTASDTPGYGGTVGWYVPVAEHLDWIHRQTGKPVPAAAGEPAALVDATAYPTVVPHPSITPPLTGSSAVDDAIRTFLPQLG